MNPINGTCYTCFDDQTFIYHGLTDVFHKEIERYVSNLEEGLVIKCTSCDRTVQFNKTTDGKKWNQTLWEGVQFDNY